SPQTVELTGMGLALNPVPIVFQPLVPSTAAPGGAGFTLTVNGAGFVPGAAINWNGSPRTTTLGSGTRVTGAISASDITTFGGATVTVTNPGLGGGTSNVAYFQITGQSSPLLMTKTNVPVGGVYDTPASIATGDFNGDGNLDLVTTSNYPYYPGPLVSVLLGIGNGTFKSYANYPTACCATAVAAGDFNGDGKPDLAVANGNNAGYGYYGSTVSILLGNGDGTFQSHVDYSVGSNPTGIASGDFNGDGKLDLVAVNNSSNSVSVLTGIGDGTFKSHVDYATGTGPSSVAVGDFNGDGKLDLAVSNDSANTISILLGNGDGTFKPHIDYPVGKSTTSLAVADVNGDGKLDLIVTNGNNNSVSVLLGKGDGTFGTAAVYPTGNGPYGIAVGDFSGNGNLDLAVSNSSDNTVSILFGNGNGTFQAPVNFSTGPNSLFLVSGDFNNDGRLDIAVADFNQSVVSVLIQAPLATLSNSTLTFANQQVATL